MQEDNKTNGTFPAYYTPRGRLGGVWRCIFNAPALAVACT